MKYVTRMYCLLLFLCVVECTYTEHHTLRFGYAAQKLKIQKGDTIIYHNHYASPRHQELFAILYTVCRDAQNQFTVEPVWHLDQKTKKYNFFTEEEQRAATKPLSAIYVGNHSQDIPKPDQVHYVALEHFYSSIFLENPEWNDVVVVTYKTAAKDKDTGKESVRNYTATGRLIWGEGNSLILRTTSRFDESSLYEKNAKPYTYNSDGLQDFSVFASKKERGSPRLGALKNSSY